MPTAPTEHARRWLSRVGFLRLRLAILSLGAGLVCSVGPPAWAQTAAVSRVSQALAPKPTPSSPSKRPYDKKWGKLEGTAVWYPVPVNSLAKRRAGKNELTAAHNRLPLGAMVRVTHLQNGKSVVVRITDRGITSRRVLIDLCKEAAEKLGMIGEGSAPVRLEVLPDDADTHAAARPKTAAPQP
jgi:rare lipoprotein A (peptidoglycan hydrolase)